MAFLIVGDERIALQIGDNVLGGTGEESVAVGGLPAMQPFARIGVFLEVRTTIRRILRDARVSVDGVPLDDAARELRHGSRIEYGGLTIVFGDLGTIGTTAHVAGITDDVLALAGEPLDGAVAADTGGVLEVLREGRKHAVPAEGLTIGRDPSCGVVLAGREVSRVHASVSPSLRGYTITDLGINGVFVNGARVDQSRVLRRGDTIRIGDDEFRFDADAATVDPSPALVAAASSRAAAAPRGSGAGPVQVGHGAPVTAPAPALLATLEVATEGPLRGTRFRLTSALAHIGRGEHNAVVIPDSSVSGSHATLLHRGGRWLLLDLGSTNGTYLDGERVVGERVMDGAAEIRVGDIRLVFRPITAPAEPATTRGIVGVTG